MGNSGKLEVADNWTLSSQGLFCKLSRSVQSPWGYLSSIMKSEVFAKSKTKFSQKRRIDKPMQGKGPVFIFRAVDSTVHCSVKGQSWECECDLKGIEKCAIVREYWQIVELTRSTSMRGCCLSQPLPAPFRSSCMAFHWARALFKIVDQVDQTLI